MLDIQGAKNCDEGAPTFEELLSAHIRGERRRLQACLRDDHGCVLRYMYDNMNVCIYVCMYVYLYVCMYVRMYVCMCVCVYACMYVLVYVCLYVCICVCM